jgi:hypothetical protein
MSRLDSIGGRLYRGEVLRLIPAADRDVVHGTGPPHR